MGNPSRIEAMPNEGVYICDSCGEEIVIPIDPTAGSRQECVEDCPICCRANVVRVEIDADNTVHIRAAAE